MLVVVVGLLIFCLQVNRADHQEIEVLIRPNGQEEEALQAKLEQARLAYQGALAARDRDQVRKLGEAYYACKT